MPSSFHPNHRDRDRDRDSDDENNNDENVLGEEETTTVTTTNIAMVTTSSMTTNEKTKRKSLALNSHMDYYTMARLLRGLEEDLGYQYENLSLYGIDLDYNMSHEICDQLSRWTQIELDHCQGEYLHKAVSDIFQHENIRKLSIHGQQLDDKTIEALGQGLRKVTHGLVELTLTLDMSTETTHILCEAINHHLFDHHHHQQQQQLNDDQQQTQLPIKTKTMMSEKLPSTVAPKDTFPTTLSKLNLSRCDFDPDAILILCQGLKENFCLQCLQLENCRLEDDEIAKLSFSLRYHPSLLEWNICMNYAESEAIIAIADMLRSIPKLQSLDLSQQNPGVLDLAELAQAFYPVDTVDNNAGNDDEKCKKGYNHTLRSLNLRENFLHDAHIPYLIRALQHQSYPIAPPDLQTDTETDADAFPTTTTMTRTTRTTTNTMLEEINLENCELGDATWTALINGLSTFSPSVKKIWLRDNRFHKMKNVGEDSIHGDNSNNDNREYGNDDEIPQREKLLIQALQCNTNIQVLDLEDEFLPSKAQFLLLLNWAGRTFMAPNSIPASVWPYLLARVNQRFSKWTVTVKQSIDNSNRSGGGDAGSGNINQPPAEENNGRTTAATTRGAILGEESYANHKDENIQNRVHQIVAADIIFYLLHGPALLERR